MPDIQQLSAAVINKIAAGEVIERPASVVKELMENSVDAGATRIEVSIEKGGSQLIRVADNGCGISAEQLPLAVASHATSKIRTADDLFAVDTLGFRGEALASISEVSEFLLRSRQAESDGGAELEVLGGVRQEISPCGCPVGTTIEVRNLFFNTPVRRKFLRTTQTEMGHCSEAFTRIALAEPKVHFCLRHNDRVLHDLPPVDRWSDRIVALFGEEIGPNLIWVDGGDDEVKVFGYVADPQINRSNNRMQYLFLNGRHIRDRALQHALGEAYRGLLMTGKFAVCFLQVRLEPATVDVNVHPTKLEVRFQDGGRVYSRVLGVLRNKFLTTDLTARVREPADADAGAEPRREQMESADRRRRELRDWAAQQVGGEAAAGDPPRRHQERLNLEFAPPPLSPRMSWSDSDADPAAVRRGPSPLPPELLSDADVRGPSPPAASDFSTSPPYATPSAEPSSSSAATSPSASSAAPASPRGRAIQLHNRYLVAEADEGMIVVDQHALHERILYEQLRRKISEGRLESQRMLTPEPVSLTAAEAATVLDAEDALGRLGIEVQAFGGDTVLVSSYPAMLRKIRPAEMLRHIVELLLAGGEGPQKRDVFDELLQMMSCKAAVKAGDPLAPEEIEALMDRREVCQDAHHCPHGRPTALVFTKDDLDKRFKRI